MAGGKDARKITLIFEAGGNADIAARMVDLLKFENLSATIFLEGQWTASNSQLVKEMVASGHELGNHSYSHPNFTYLADEQIRQELDATDELVRQLTGTPAHPWLRLPYGAIDMRVRKLVSGMGYRIIQRNAVDGGHWPGKTNPGRIFSRAIENAHPGAVIAFHLSSPMTLGVLPKIVRKLRDEGYTFCCLSDLDEVYEREEKHPDFDHPNDESGFLEVKRRNTRAWSLNLREFATNKHIFPGREVEILTNHHGSTDLIIGEPEEVWENANPYDCYLYVIAGSVFCRLREEGNEEDSIHAYICTNDLLLWPEGYELYMGEGPEGKKRYVILKIKNASLPD